ncbi:MAG: CpaF family protein [Chloroflexi bacterium]|jgi:pilus assembly protein CpaF|nr:CpaF family protein [Chloroflexota bacterium]MBT3668997.1 CpaF family protein [Chloroflexota bacterium]MBT4003598.1 CpaF family protein [Chloroflexota bacterium]MBT4304968.1 CpaF family protein [Chloroflexota bacterium]MBT4533269.1 CpaF family protein [Chloroflexota bacterium]
MSNNNPENESNISNLNKLRAYIFKEVKIVVGNGSFDTNELASTMENVCKQMNVHIPEKIKSKLFLELKNDLLGFGPIQILLDDPNITEVMVNGPKSVYAEINGKLEKTAVMFENDAEVIRLIEKIVLPIGRRIDKDSPAVDARLPDGSRVNAIIPPVAIDGPSITIRKFAKDRLGIQDLIEFGSLTAQMGDFLEACVKAHLNIVVSGGTGSGKTTLLNILSSFIQDTERIVTIEDAAELQLQQDHVVRLETKVANTDGIGQMTIRDLLRNSLRMRPDRIVIGEVRGGEALDMLQAMNTGHDGSLTTVHANNPRDSISRLETLTMQAGIDMPIPIIRKQIASAVDLIVQQSRIIDGSRKVTNITEIAGMEGDTVVMTDLFEFEQIGISPEGKVIGNHRPTGIRPLFMSKLQSAGFNLGADIFIPEVKK